MLREINVEVVILKSKPTKDRTAIHMHDLSNSRRISAFQVRSWGVVSWVRGVQGAGVLLQLHGFSGPELAAHHVVHFRAPTRCRSNWIVVSPCNIWNQIHFNYRNPIEICSHRFFLRSLYFEYIVAHTGFFIFIFILCTLISYVDTLGRDSQWYARVGSQWYVSLGGYDLIVARFSDRHATANSEKGDTIISMESQSKRNGDTLRKKHQR